MSVISNVKPVSGEKALVKRIRFLIKTLSMQL